MEYWFTEHSDCDIETIRTPLDVVAIHREATEPPAIPSDQANGSRRKSDVAVGGVVGSPGLESPELLLMHANDRVWARVTKCSRTFEGLISGSPMTRQSPFLVTSRHPTFFGTQFSMSSKTSPPPCPPSFRSEDLVFWSLLRVVDARATCAHLPFCVEHPGIWGTRKPTYRAGTALLLAETIGSMASSSLPSSTPNLKSIGSRLEGLTRSLPSFIEWAVNWARAWSRSAISHCESLLERRGNAPSFALAVVQHRIATWELVQYEVAYAVPREFCASVDPWGELAAYVRNYGLLLQAWPSMLDAAESIAEL